MTCRIDENVLDSGTGFPGMLRFFCNGQKGMYEVGRECKASIFRVIIFDISILRLKFDDKFVNMDIGP